MSWWNRYYSIVDQYHWMYLIDNESVVISSIFHHNYCCSLQNGCNYVNNRTYLCADNRDYNSLLCSKCNKGYSKFEF